MKNEKFLKFVRYASPDEAFKWWLREEHRIVYVNVDKIEYVDTQMVTYYNNKGGEETEWIPRLNFSDSENTILVDGTIEDVLEKINGGKTRKHITAHSKQKNGSSIDR